LLAPVFYLWKIGARKRFQHILPNLTMLQHVFLSPVGGLAMTVPAVVSSFQPAVAATMLMDLLLCVQASVVLLLARTLLRQFDVRVEI
jgi:hypothetical protein